MTDSRNPSTRLERSVDDNVFAGVCGGLGEQFGINAWWFRWAFIILTLFGFAGVFFYILAWILIPKETDDESVATSWMERLDLTDIGVIFGVVLLGIAGVLVLSQFFNVSGGLIAAGVLAIVGVLLYRGDLRPPDRPDRESRHYLDEDEPSSDTEPASSEAGSAEPPAETTSAGASAASAVAAKPARPREQKVKKPRPPKSMLGRLTMAVLLIVLSTMAMAELSDWYHFQPVDYTAAAMIVVAVGLIVGAWVGRARWLIVIGILLAPWLLFGAFLPTVSEWSIGDPTYRPQTAAEVRESYELGIGQLTIDLRNLTTAEIAEIGELDGSVGMGQLVVYIPDGSGATVDAEVGMGSVSRRIDGSVLIELDSDGEHLLTAGRSSETYSGVGVNESFDIGVSPFDLRLDLEVGMGEIELRYEQVEGNEG